MRHNIAEPYSQWQNHAERAIHELERGVYRVVQKVNAPKRIWDYCAEHQAEIRSMTASDFNQQVSRK